MKKLLIIIGLLTWIFVIACHDIGTSKSADKNESCTKEETIKDPNHPKPMALMMRTMANYCDSMRLDLKADKTIDSLKYPLLPFWKAEPTDSSNLVNLFYDNASQYEKAYRQLMSNTNNQKENYTNVINSCVNCHNSFCSGPLKRIRKLTLDFKEK
jgi:thioredoxin-related protein